MASDIEKVNLYQEAILGSIEAYYNEKQKYNQYDVTVEATVTNVDRKPNGIYRVKSTNAEFDAYATAGSYYKNDLVLVQIPNGDYKNPKYILGRKEGAAENQIFSFKLPFDDFIGLRYLNQGNSFSGKYWANYPTYNDSDSLHLQNEERGQILNVPVWHWTNEGSSTIGCTRLGIEVDWQTYLGMYQPLRGVYGFRIILKGVTSSTEVSAQTEIVREEYFTNYDMYGNTYAYYTPYTQQKVIDISDFTNVHSIDIYFYQDFNFADASNKTIYYNEVDNTAQVIDGKLVPTIPENIQFDNVNIYLGVSAEDIKDESTYLYSYGPYSYTGIETNNYNDSTGQWVESTTYSCNTKHDLHFVWVHYEENGTYSVIDKFEELIKQRGEDGLKTTHVFWYRYLYDEDITEEELTWSDNHEELRKDWEDSLKNDSYETKMERYGGPNWTLIPAWTDTFKVEFIPRGNKSKEKFKVVVQHDGTHTSSKEREFINTRDIEAEIASGAKNDAIVLKCFKLKKVRDIKNDWTGEYEAIEDGSMNAFHIYDENNTILYNDDDERYDQHAYYIQIQVRNEDTNKYELLTTIAENGTETNTQVAWAFPRSYSMIESTQEVDIYDAAYFGIDAVNEPIRYQNFHNSTIKFTIQSVYNNRYLDNTIGAIIRRNEKDHHIERELMFGRAEGQGHEFLPIIEIIYPTGGTYLRTDNEFQIACAVYNKDGSLFESPSLLTFNWQELGQQSEFYHYNNDGEQIEGYQIASYPVVDTNDENYEQYIDSTYINKYKGYRGNVIRGYLKGNNAKPPIFEVTVNGAASYPLIARKGFLVCNNHAYKQQCDITVPSRVEFKSDGADPIFYNDVFKVAHLTSKVSSSTATYDIEYPEWKINNENIFHLQSSTKVRSTIEPSADKDNVVDINDRSYVQYKLAFNTLGHPQWTDTYLKPDSYTYIYYNSGNTYVAQSIAFDRNYYSSSLVSDWDGTSLTWDEENGAILSTMIAAGSKDTNNKFTGVMMGDWHAKGDESLDTPGFYGYNTGEQTFGFKTDGTGFIGASGRGRIEFDGTEALISNADRTCYINLNPMVFSLTEADSRNQSFSQNFLYCKVPKTSNVFNTISDAILGEESWARPYFQDNVNDYFVVDPNYGVLTTGGIVARYGAIGNWMISHEGLYQKSDTHKKYMYLGYDVYGEEKYQQGLKEAASNYENAKQTALNNKTTLIDKVYEKYVADLTYYNENKNSTDSEIIKQLYLYDLDHYMNIGHGLAITISFLEECIQFALADLSDPNRLENYFNDEYDNYYNSYADKGWHYHYDENGVQSARQYQTGWAITLREICKLGDEEKDNTLIEATYYGTQVVVPRVAGIYTLERFQQIINACYAGYQVFENDQNKQIAEAWRDYPDRIKVIYDYEVSLIEDQYIKDLAAAESNYNEVLQELNNTKTGTGNDRYCIYAGESDPAKAPAVQPGSPVETDPYFYVKWDGTFFARRGLIANTWTVDDTSLIYEKYNEDQSLTTKKIFDKIYIGKGEANEAFIDPEIEEKIYPDVTTRPVQKRWSISAGQKIDYTSENTPDTDYINFGVTLNGELYSQLGTIGGWKISESQLYAANGKMIFDSEQSVICIGDATYVGKDGNGKDQYAYSIMIDGKNGLMSIAGTNHQDLTTGFLYLGNLSLEAISVDSEWQVPYAITQSNDTYHKKELEDARGSFDVSNSWDGGSSGGITATVAPLEYYDQITTTNTKKLTSSNTFNIITRDNTGNYGVAIASGITDNGEKITAMYPTGCSDNNSSLGILGHRWNIYANALDAASINTAGVISAYNMYMNKEKVATEPWVYNLLADVWNALNSLNDAAGSNAGSIGKLGGALAAQAIVNVTVEESQPGVNLFSYNNKQGARIVGTWAPAVGHSHQVDLFINGTMLRTRTGTTIGAMSGFVDGCSLSHHHELTGSMSGNGVLTVTVGDANFNSATGTYTIDCSAWLEEERRKVWATAAASSGRVGSSNTIRYPSSTYGKFNTITATANATASLGGHGQDCDVKYSASGEAWHDIDSYDTHYAYVSSTSVSWS